MSLHVILSTICGIVGFFILFLIIMLVIVMLVIVRAYTNVNKIRKERNFKDEEENQLCRSFLHVSKEHKTTS
jgi:uncharacterized membrane protein